MKKIAFVVAIGALGSMASACPSPARTDTGISIPDDTGPLARDTGTPRDAFRRPDAPAAMCSAYPGISATMIAAIPASCTPRCTNATLGAVNACMDGTCLGNALMADTTPSVSMPVGTMTVDLDCGTCFDINRFHCFSLVCMTEAPAYFGCDQAMDADMCMGELTALQTCLDGVAMGSAQETTLNDCFATEVTGCFDTSGAFAPSTAAISNFSRNVSANFSTARAALR